MIRRCCAAYAVPGLCDAIGVEYDNAGFLGEKLA